MIPYNQHSNLPYSVLDRICKAIGHTLKKGQKAAPSRAKFIFKIAEFAKDQ